MRIRGPLAPGPIALMMVAVVAAPEVLRRCRPLARSLADFLEGAGREVRRIAEEPTSPPPANGSASETPVPPSTAATEPTPEIPNEPAARSDEAAPPQAASEPEAKGARRKKP